MNAELSPWNYYLNETHTIHNAGNITIEPPPAGDGVVSPYGVNYISLINKNDDIYGTQYGIVFDKEMGVILWIIPRGGYYFLKTFYCDQNY